MNVLVDDGNRLLGCLLILKVEHGAATLLLKSLAIDLRKLKVDQGLLNLKGVGLLEDYSGAKLDCFLGSVDTLMKFA